MKQPEEDYVRSSSWCKLYQELWRWLILSPPLLPLSAVGHETKPSPAPRRPDQSAAGVGKRHAFGLLLVSSWDMHLSPVL